MTTKYKSKAVEIDGYVFQSKIEAKYYEHLKWLLEHKEIKSFSLQPRYILLDKFRKNGKTYRKMEYIADFEVHHLDGSIEVVDVKGFETEAFKIKRKLFEHKYPYKLSLVTYVKKYGGWIELDELKKRRKETKKQNK
jgi:Protein of unknown function (DUF1064)